MTFLRQAVTQIAFTNHQRSSIGYTDTVSASPGEAGSAGHFRGLAWWHPCSCPGPDSGRRVCCAASLQRVSAVQAPVKFISWPLWQVSEQPDLMHERHHCIQSCISEALPGDTPSSALHLTMASYWLCCQLTEGMRSAGSIQAHQLALVAGTDL